MNIVRLIYASRPRISILELAEDIESFREKNAQNSITGLLVLGDNFFLQWVEGPRPRVNALLRSLILDDRHTDVEIVHFEEVHARQFPRWDMRCIMSTDINDSILLRYMYESGFDPYQLSGAACVEFLKEVGRITDNA